MGTIKYFSTFSGIGGFELGIEQAAEELGLQVECIGFSEIDKFAESVYKNHFKNIRNYGNIKEIKTEELPDFDLLVGGFPCQDVSIMGKRAGLAGERTGLFYELPELSTTKNQNTLFSRMSKVFLAPTKEKISSKYYKPLRGWATKSNGEYLTANTSNRLNTVNELSWSDFFEKNVPQKYYLSLEKNTKLFSLMAV